MWLYAYVFIKQASVSNPRNGSISSTSHQNQLLRCCFAVNTLKGEDRRVVCSYSLMQESVHVTLHSCHATFTWSFQWRVAFLRFSRLHDDVLVAFLKRFTLKCFFQTQRFPRTFCSFTCKQLGETLQNDSVFLWNDSVFLCIGDGTGGANGLRPPQYFRLFRHFD